MSTGKIELSVGAVKIADKDEILTEEEIDAINNKIPELDKRVGDIEDEIEGINNITNKIPELDKRVGDIEEIKSSLETMLICNLRDFPRLEGEKDDKLRFERIFQKHKDKYLKLYVINEDLYFTMSKNKDSGINLISNIELININSSYTVNSNGYSNYYLFKMYDVENVNIVGGKFIGDKDTHDYSSGGTHEWGHGIYVVKTKNININNVTIEKFTGDGIHLGSNNECTNTNRVITEVNIKNSLIKECRRQGISVVNGTLDLSNTIIKDIKGIDPQAGIDIEPNTNLEYTDVRINNLKTINCSGGGLVVYGTNFADINGSGVKANNGKYHNLIVDGFTNESSTYSFGLYISYQEENSSGSFRGCYNLRNIELYNSNVNIFNWSEENPTIKIDNIKIESLDTNLNHAINFARGSQGYHGNFNIGGLHIDNIKIDAPTTTYGILINDEGVNNNGVKNIIISNPSKCEVINKFNIAPLKSGDNYNIVDPLNILNKYISKVTKMKEITPLSGMNNISYDNASRQINLYKNNEVVRMYGRFRFVATSGTKKFKYIDDLNPSDIYTGHGKITPMGIKTLIYDNGWKDAILNLTKDGISITGYDFIDGKDYVVMLNIEYVI